MDKKTSEAELRNELEDVVTPNGFIAVLKSYCEQLVVSEENESSCVASDRSDCNREPLVAFGSGILENIRRRWFKYYISDYVDGLTGNRTISKVLSTIFFLYFLCILPCIAFGVLNAKNTGGKIG